MAQIRIATVLLLLGWPAFAAAQTDDQRAANHFRAGTSYLSEGQNVDALREFRAAHRLSGRPEMQYNIGLALERLGRWEEAQQAYQDFLREKPDDPHAAEVRTRIDEIRQRAAEDPNAPTSEAPEAAKPGPEIPADEPEAASDGLPVPWIILGGSAAVGVAALITGLAAHGINNDLEDQCDGSVCPASLEDDADRGQTLATVSTILTFASIAGAAAGAALLFLADEESSGERLSWGIAPTPDGVATSARVAF